MNREIKFRAWNKENTIMHQPVSLLSNWDNNTMSYKSETHQFIYMQYTGLKDKNDKEIYEGDIVKEDRSNGISEVIWSNETITPLDKEPVKGMFGEYVDLSGFFTSLGEFRLKPKQGTNQKAFHIQDTEIIGNIYENPDLLVKQ